MREGFAVGESSDNENRNQSAGEIEADDVKARQSMSKDLIKMQTLYFGKIAKTTNMVM